MIKVRIMLPPGWGRMKKALDERYWLELPDEAKLNDALRAIKMPALVAKTMFVAVNGALSKTNAPLMDGDSISFFPMVFGG